MVSVDWVFLGLRIITVLGGVIWVSYYPEGQAPGRIDTGSLFSFYLGFVAYSLLLFFGLVRFPSKALSFYRASFWLDLIFISAIIRATGGFASSFFIAYYLLIALHTAYYSSLVTGGLASLAGAAAYLLALYGRFEGVYWGDLMMRLSMMPLVGLSTGLLVKQLAEAKEQLEANGVKLAESNKLLERKLTQVNSLYEASKALGSLLHYDEVIRLIVGLAGETLDSPVSYMMMTNERGQLYFRSSSGIRDDLLKDAYLEPGTGVAGRVYLSGTPAVIEDLLNHPESSLTEIDRQAQLRSLLAVPILNKGRTVGVLNVARHEPGCYSHEDLQLLQVVATLAAAAIEKAEVFEEAQRAAVTDGLTGLYNRRYFSQQLEVEVRRGQRYSFPVCLVIMDIDHFKKINDTYGHPGGDQILREVSRRLKGLARHSDVVARYGGEEFAIILPQTPMAGAMTFAERVRLEVGGQKFRLNDGREIPVTISLGVAEYPSHAKSVDELLNEADKGLYQAKVSGRNRVCQAGGEGRHQH